MSEDLLNKLGSKALAAERARLARFFQTINKHRKALDMAIEENFAGRLDPAEWRRAFQSERCTYPRDHPRDGHLMVATSSVVAGPRFVEPIE